MKDGDIIRLLHEWNRATFFMRDDDFFARRLCHQGYCLVYLDVGDDEVAEFVRRILRHREFNTRAIDLRPLTPDLRLLTRELVAPW